MKTIEGESNKILKDPQDPPIKEGSSGMISHAEKEDEMFQEFYESRRKSCLGWLEGFAAGLRDEFFYAVDWPLEDEASAERLLSDAGVSKDVKKTFVLTASRHGEPKWHVEYILLSRNMDIKKEAIERCIEEIGKSRMYKIIMG